MAKRNEMQWMRVAWLGSVYGGVCDRAESPVFITDDDPRNDRDGDDCIGYWRVWDNFFNFKRDYPYARFEDDGYIWVWAD